MPTGTMAFNIVIAVIGVIITLAMQAKKLWFRWFIHEYIPVTGKGILVDKSSTTKTSIGAKIGDIALSLFIGLLDIVWIFAKIISLSARLFGNMVSGTLLLAMLVFALASGSQRLFGIDSALFLPLILVAQGLLVGVIQAFVFPILIAIFVKVWQAD
jgi:F0F1-type ATP synthase membrane subunit a